MKRTIGVVLLLGVALMGWAENLVLTVHSDNGDPGEERAVWTQSYFTDDSGRLVHIHLVTKGRGGSDSDGVTDTLYQWEQGKVSWDTKNSGWTYHDKLAFGDDQLVQNWDAKALLPGQKDYSGRRVFRIVSGPGTQWEDERYRYVWSNEKGFSQTKRLDASPGSSALTEYTTTGSRVTEWYKSLENHTVLLDKRPRILVGHYVTQNENMDGWITTGEITLSGPGLWSRDAVLNLVHAVIINDALVMPFLFVETYLR